MAAAVSPFARSSAFEESLLSAREQTVRPAEDRWSRGTNSPELYL